MNAADAYEHVLFALAVWREARGESPRARLGVARVILNRTKDRRWPNTVAGVILQHNQFSSFNAKDPNAAKLPQPCEPAWRECCALVDELASVIEDSDPTNGANHYHSLPASVSWPTWAEPNYLTAVIGPFHFYKR